MSPITRAPLTILTAPVVSMLPVNSEALMEIVDPSKVNTSDASASTTTLYDPASIVSHPRLMIVVVSPA